MRTLCLFAVFATIGTVAVACGSSESGGGDETRTSTAAATASDEVVENPIPIGWGYHSDTGNSTGGSCWDLPSDIAKYTNVQSVDTVVADHSWSSTREEASSELHANLDADADFDLFDADVTASYDETRKTVAESDVLTLRIFIRTVDVHFEHPSDLNSSRCYGTKDDPMRLDQFLRECGDRYISNKDFGGYLIFTAAKSDMTETEREEFSGMLKTDYSIGKGNLSGYAKTLAKLEDAEFEFRVVSRGFTNILLSSGVITGDPTDRVSPSKVLDELAKVRDSWVREATASPPKFPSSNYGVTVDQEMSRYSLESTLYERCTGVPPGDELVCYDNYMNTTQGKVPTYRRWEHVVGRPVDDAGNYYWGATTSQANENKEDYQRVRDLLNDCMTRIESFARECAQVAKSESEQPEEEVCFACAGGEPPYNCSPYQYDDTKCSHDTSIERQQCIRPTDLVLERLSRSRHDPCVIHPRGETHGIKDRKRSSILDTAGRRVRANQWRDAV
jgi:hypothetical protein